MHSASVLRRRVSFAVVALVALVGLVMAMSLRTSAQATPAYPPTSPCTSMSAGAAAGSNAGSTCSPSHGAEPAATHRHRSSAPAANPGNGAQDNHGTDSGTAVTGFAALTATVIAVLLLGGGVLFLTVGRRRHS